MGNCYGMDEEEKWEREREIRNLMNNPKELQRRLMVGEGCDDEAEEASIRTFWRDQY